MGLREEEFQLETDSGNFQQILRRVEPEVELELRCQGWRLDVRNVFMEVMIKLRD